MTLKKRLRSLCRFWHQKIIHRNSAKRDRISLNSSSKKRRTEKPSSPRKPILVKVFSPPAAAGPGSFLTNEDHDMIEFDPANVPEDTDFGIRVTGDSMLPRYVPGQVVFVYDDNAYIKQYTESTPDEDDLDYYMTSEGVVKPQIDLISLNRDNADCDVDVRPENMLIIVSQVLN